MVHHQQGGHGQQGLTQQGTGHEDWSIGPIHYNQEGSNSLSGIHPGMFHVGSPHWHTLALLRVDRLRWMAPHVVPLHGLGAGPCFETEKSKVSIYVWALDTVLGQTPLSVLVNPSWLFVEE